VKPNPKSEARNPKSEFPNPKPQNPNKFKAEKKQIQKKKRSDRLFGSLGFLYLDLFGIWGLGFGI
jgi:hypothetical protein